MRPGPGEHLARHVGERLHVVVEAPDAHAVYLRGDCNAPPSYPDDPVWSEESRWRDVVMRSDGDAWRIALPLTRVGHYRFKAFAVDGDGARVWPDGPDAGVSVHPAAYAADNSYYCAFVRCFGQAKGKARTRDPMRDSMAQVYDEAGYALIPPSGRFRDLIAELPHIFDRLGFRILHLLPINPTPTVHARYGRYGSPYASTDYFAVDPALVEHDRRTTGLDQFAELADAVHAAGGRLVIDVAINHTGWNSRLQNVRPEWFERDDRGHFRSPGAWGTIWEDLVELDHGREELRDYLAEVFLFWCERGVDGFRCDAGYMIPVPAWRHIVARVRERYPDTCFLLEGLGGAWEATADLLREGGMQQAYSELFQNYDGEAVRRYLAHAWRASAENGLMVHYAETHDNDRLAAKGERWSRFRNRLCALASLGGGYGITCGVEWLATEKIDVHGASGLNWGAKDHLVDEIARLNALLNGHPCFGEGATCELLPQDGPEVVAWLRRHGDERLLVLANCDRERRLPLRLRADLRHLRHDLLAGATMRTQDLDPLSVHCLARAPWSREDDARRDEDRRELRGWCVQRLAEDLDPAAWGDGNDDALVDLAAADPVAFLGGCARIDAAAAADDPVAALRVAIGEPGYDPVIEWEPARARGEVVVPADHRFLVHGTVPFRLRLESGDEVREWRSDRGRRAPLLRRTPAVARPGGAGVVPVRAPRRDHPDADPRRRRRHAVAGKGTPHDRAADKQPRRNGEAPGRPATDRLEVRRGPGREPRPGGAGRSSRAGQARACVARFGGPLDPPRPHELRDLRRRRRPRDLALPQRLRRHRAAELHRRHARWLQRDPTALPPRRVAAPVPVDRARRLRGS